MEEFDVIIIGAGASGTMCALSADKDKRIALVDAMSFPAKKLLVTGNGRCNLTNVKLSSDFYNQDLTKYFAMHDNSQTLSFFEELGLLINIDEESRVYPYSNSARTITDILFKEIKKRNIFLFCEQNITKITRMGEFYCVKTNDYVLYSKKVVFATGGNTNPEFFEELDINLKPFVPSLCALKTQSTKRLSGQKLSDVVVTAVCDGDKKQQKGEVLFKDSGLSGIVIFNLSTLFARKNKFEGKVYIDTMPHITIEDVFDLLTERKKIAETAGELLLGMFHHEINKEILWRNNLDEQTSIDELDDNLIQAIAQTIKHFDFNVDGAYDNNQVFCGGVTLDQLDDTLQSINNHGIYFCGEICDVDGECGGYNLQWAWTSGNIVGVNL